MTRTALVIGCGGTIGGAWTIAALHHLVDQTGWDPASASILQGTSAGAEIVTMLAGAHSVADLVAMQQGNPPNSVLCSHLADCPSSLPKLPAPVLPSLSALRAGGPGHSRLTGVAPRGRGDTAWLQRLADASTGNGSSATGYGLSRTDPRTANASRSARRDHPLRRQAKGCARRGRSPVGCRRWRSTVARTWTAERRRPHRLISWGPTTQT